MGDPPSYDQVQTVKWMAKTQKWLGECFVEFTTNQKQTNKLLEQLLEVHKEKKRKAEQIEDSEYDRALREKASKHCEAIEVTELDASSEEAAERNKGFEREEETQSF